MSVFFFLYYEIFERRNRKEYYYIRDLFINILNEKKKSVREVSFRFIITCCRYVCRAVFTFFIIAKPKDVTPTGLQETRR